MAVVRDLRDVRSSATAEGLEQFETDGLTGSCWLGAQRGWRAAPGWVVLER